MESLTVIRSRHNPRYKALSKTLAGKLPAGLIVLEGKRLVTDALYSAVDAELIVLAEEAKMLIQASPFKEANVETLIVESSLFARLSATVTPQGVLLIAKLEERKIESLVPEDGDRLLILDGLSDPGNVGTLLRSAEAFGFSDVVYTEAGVSPLSRKAVRSSMGSILRQSIYRVDNMDSVMRYMNALSIRLLALDTDGLDIAHLDLDSRALALIVGNEAHGISEAVRKSGVTPITIPMLGKVESLNAAVAGAIAMYKIGAPCK